MTTHHDSNEGRVERLNKQVKVGMFGMDNPASFRECLNLIEAQAREIARKDAALETAKAELARLGKELQLTWGADEGDDPAILDTLVIIDAALSNTQEQRERR